MASSNISNAVYAYDNNCALPSTGANWPGADPEVNISNAIGILRRKWRMPLLGCVIGLALGVTFILLFPTLYKSSTRILIDGSASRYLHDNKIAYQPAPDEMETRSQLHVFSSESIIIPVVRSMNLAHDPEFVDQPETREKMAKAAMHLVGGNTGSALNPDTVLERTAVETFLKRLTVSREDVDSVINVTFASKDPQKAANIANALADTYLATVLEDRFSSNKTAVQLLQNRLADLKRQLGDADQALRDHRASNGARPPYSAHISSIDPHLMSARMALIESKAQLEHGRSAAIPDNDVTLKLRSQYLDLSVATGEIESRVGSDHIAVVKLRERMDRLRAAIQNEKERISRTYPSELGLAKARYDKVTAAFAELASEASASDQAQTSLRDLESKADMLRSSYKNTLQKLSEVDNIKPRPVTVQDARIITRAAPPLQKDTRVPLAALGGGIVLGLLLGAGAALAGELGGGAYRTPGQVRSATDIYCGIMPAVETHGRQIASPQAGTRSRVLEEYVLDAPYSRFTETVRNISVLVEGAHRANRDKVFCVVSSVANEGKTTILTNLATLVATSSTARVLIIDCDLRSRRLTTKLAPHTHEGLMEALDDPSRLAMLVSKRERSGVDILPCARATRMPNAGELLGSPQMETLLHAARQAYDFVLIEVPPIMSVVDVKMIERFVDRFVFVVEWGKTNRQVVQEALAEAEIIRDRLMCIVLNKADPAALLSLEAYKGARFGDYYIE